MINAKTDRSDEIIIIVIVCSHIIVILSHYVSIDVLKNEKILSEKA